MSQNPNSGGRIITPFKKQRDAVFASKGQGIYTSMLNNPFYVTPTPDMPTVLAALGDYTTALAAAQTRERTAIIIKNQNRAILTDVLKSLATYITFTSQGRLDELSTTGYDLGKTRSKSPAINKPLAPSVTDGANSGELVSTADAVKGARNYVHQYKPSVLTGDNDWVSIFSSLRTCTLTGLVAGQKYSVRIGALGTNNQVMYSDTVSRIVQ